MELLLGCGYNKTKQVVIEKDKEWKNLVTLDMNKDVNPDVVHNLNEFPYPFKRETFDEIHAYDVVEHLGQQGDFYSFFDFFGECWELLKPGGIFVGRTPAWNSPWAWGDPGHTRIIGQEQLSYLYQPLYDECGITARTDYRFCYSADYDLLHSDNKGDHYVFVLQAVKPSRCKKV